MPVMPQLEGRLAAVAALAVSSKLPPLVISGDGGHLCHRLFSSQSWRRDYCSAQGWAKMATKTTKANRRIFRFVAGFMRQISGKLTAHCPQSIWMRTDIRETVSAKVCFSDIFSAEYVRESKVCHFYGEMCPRRGTRTRSIAIPSGAAPSHPMAISG
jgi:hypothetical protein